MSITQATIYEYEIDKPKIKEVLLILSKMYLENKALIDNKDLKIPFASLF